MRTLEEKSKDMVKVMGMDVPEWQDCVRCGAKLACRFGSFSYNQPCTECQNDEAWQQEEEEKTKQKPRISMSEALKAGKPAAVWEHKGRLVYSDHKGNIIKDESWRPLEAGKKDWK